MLNYDQSEFKDDVLTGINILLGSPRTLFVYFLPGLIHSFTKLQRWKN